MACATMNDKGAGFGKDTNKITIFAKNGNAISFETKFKSEVANDIIDTILKNN
jgi:phosphopantothenoylcysteine decarboxylase/phosphopantothenate--cysteine ligase